MFKKLLNKKLLKNQKGLTLIELLAVIVILAIVAAIAIPAIGSIIDNSRGKALKSDVVNVMNAANIYFTDNPADDKKPSVDLETLKKDGYLESEGKLTSATVTYAAGGNTVDAAGTNGSITITVTKATLKDINDHDGKPEGKDVTITHTTTTTP
ncbi:prepilin-type N-terminal cleavage/methylation domain-containing protein [Lysinibacillus sp. CD3-6]|uniref:prepilin-type N-terminal cleavage/methylation domain-containing protein n=1 Tax=Lysinibacillus sp. CD3-6 TaxID=2892541 RepID=UPI0011682DDA|nr:prepilin-type N-terminal cleavage/methylation domain-containing protein [Lysinibacillus sp. CD3-6]UED81538.1 prepilin-type N-terminal cleavage/methylation domain-containing protein [Lysinibacillus sp. CD3-6]